MTTATTRRDSANKQFQKRVPADIVARAGGRSYPITLPAFGLTPEQVVEVTVRPAISFSLRVRDPAAAKMRVGAVTAQLEQIFASLRAGPVELTHKQSVALSGEVYRLVVERFEIEPGEPGDWEARKGFHWAAVEGRIPDPPTISWQEIMNERNAALGAFGVSHGPVERLYDPAVVAERWPEVKARLLKDGETAEFNDLPPRRPRSGARERKRALADD